MNKTKVFGQVLVMMGLYFGMAIASYAKVVRYDLTATKESINLSGNVEVDWAPLDQGTCRIKLKKIID